MLAGRGAHAAAAEMAERLRDLASKDADNLYFVARLFALCVTAVAHDKNPADLTDTDKAAQARYAEQALDALAAAIEHGWNNIALTERDSDLDSIRDNPKYEELTKRLITRK